MDQATAYYLNGHQAIGTIHSWAPLAGRIEMTPQGETRPQPLALGRLAHVDRPLKETATPGFGEEQRYVIHLVNGQVLSGTMSTVAVSDHGIFVSHRVGSGETIERFVPLQAIRTYQLGDISLPVAGKGNSAPRPAPRHQQIRADSLEAVTIADAAGLIEALERPGRGLQGDPGESLHRTLGDILVDCGVIDSGQLDEALEQKRLTPDRPLGAVLIDSGAATDEAVQQALALELGVPYVRPEKFDVDPGALHSIPAMTAKQWGVLPLIFHEGHLVVALHDPTDSGVISVLNFLTGRSVKYALATREAIARGIDRYYSAAESEEAAEELEMQQKQDQSEVALGRAAIEQLSQEKPVIRFVNSMILDAIMKNVSDIHLSPREDHVQLLYRMNGDLIPVKRFNKGLLAMAVSRIKILGGMDITERRVPQDGRATVRRGGNEIDLRISIMPTVVGESVVIRILNSNQGLKSLDSLGFSKTDHRRFNDLIHRNQGLLLITGPTGSGKSTTLYAALNAVRTQPINVLTVEDPVEYHMDGVEQMQVNEATGFTFAAALRNMLRHDPDVIMVGEIRDEETGRIAVQSALTGHLVLSTLHTNSAAATVMRLIDMGIEDYLISGTLLGVLAQRLVRRNCSHCTAPEQVDDWVREMLGVGPEEVFYRGTGCPECHQTGYSGRLAVYELLVMNSELRDEVTAGATVDQLEETAVAQGMVKLTANALARAREGHISLAEVYRIRLA